MGRTYSHKEEDKNVNNEVKFKYAWDEQKSNDFKEAIYTYELMSQGFKGKDLGIKILFASTVPA